MKHQIITILISLTIFSSNIFAQSPGFNYQAVLRDKQGTPMPNAEVTLYVTLTDGPEGAVLYRESQTLTTNGLGMLNTTVGTGSVESGQFADIISVQDLNIKLEAAIPGEPDILDFGYSPVSSTPYALYGEDADADPENEMQSLELQGDSLKITDMGGVNLQAIASPWQKISGEEAYQLALEEDAGRGTSKVMEIGCNRMLIINADGSTNLGYSSQFPSLMELPEDQQALILKLNNSIGKLFGFELHDNSIFKEYAIWGNDQSRLILQRTDIKLELFFSEGELTFTMENVLGVKGKGTVQSDCTIEYTYEGGLLTRLPLAIRTAIESELEANSLEDVNQLGSEIRVSIFEDGFTRDSKVTLSKNGKAASIKLTQEATEDGSGEYKEPKVTKFDSNPEESGEKVTISENSTQESLRQESNGALAEAQLGTDRTPDNARSEGEPLAYLNLLKNDQFGAGALTSGEGDQFGGTFSTANQNGPTTISGTFPGIDPSRAFQVVFNGSNFGVVNTNNSEAAGTTTTYGPNGNANATMGTFAGAADHGMVAVYGEDGTTPRAYMRSTGSTSEVAAEVLTMLAASPARSGNPMTFAAPMGGEAAAYDRGTGQLVNGEATINCPEHFRQVADDASMTVTITPLSAESQGIAVIEKTTGGFKVKELHGGTGNYQFDYMVMCKRKAHMDFQVEQAATKVLPDESKEILGKMPRGPIKSIKDIYQP